MNGDHVLNAVLYFELAHCTVELVSSKSAIDITNIANNSLGLDTIQASISTRTKAFSCFEYNIYRRFSASPIRYNKIR